MDSSDMLESICHPLDVGEERILPIRCNLEEREHLAEILCETVAEDLQTALVAGKAHGHVILMVVALDIDAGAVGHEVQVSVIHDSGCIHGIHARTITLVNAKKHWKFPPDT